MRCPSSSHLAVLALASALSTALAQSVDPTRLGEGVRSLPVPHLLAEQSPSELGLEDENAFAPETSGDDDIGQQLILKDSERERWLSAQFNTSAFWSDNAANLSKGGEDDLFWASQLSLGAQPRLGDRLYADTFVSQQIYRYDEFDLLDYEYFQAGLGLIYLEPRLWNSIIYGQLQFARTTTDNFGEDVLNSYSFVAGIQKTFVFDRRNSLYVNLMGDWYLDTDVNDLEHSEYIAGVSYRFKIMRDLVLSASYRFTWFDYQEVDRSDALNIMGLYLTWSPKKWMNLYAGGTFNLNESNVDVFDEKQMDAALKDQDKKKLKGDLVSTSFQIEGRGRSVTLLVADRHVVPVDSSPTVPRDRKPINIPATTVFDDRSTIGTLSNAFNSAAGGFTSLPGTIYLPEQDGLFGEYIFDDPQTFSHTKRKFHNVSIS